ncbi:LysM peptidoglycan-binding domain-containing protein, partial [Streptococcus anginosus]|uniref:LysM peptidoglycan-binding domain-containing protein n=1 Tax=Streptococcus anginosus TaxID=1328 RepID=UPI0005B52DFD
KSGETLYGISRKYGLTVEALRSANPGINPEELLVGHILKIPTSGRTHVVKAGDTLYGIARANGTTVDVLKALNPKVNADDLRIGSSIVIR